MRGVTGQQPDFKIAPIQPATIFDHQKLKDKIIDQHKQQEQHVESKEDSQKKQIPKLKLTDLVLKPGHIMPSERSGEKKLPLTANSSKKSNTPKSCENCILQAQKLKEQVYKQKEFSERVSELELKLELNLQKEKSLHTSIRSLLHLESGHDLEEQLDLKLKD